MDNDELKRQSAEAWAEVMSHPNADMRRYLGSLHGVEMRPEKGSGKVEIKVCPLCQGKGCSVLLLQDSGQYIFKCRHASCSSGEEAMGIQKFIEHTQGCDWKQARRVLHELTGVPDPREQVEHRTSNIEHRTSKQEKEAPVAVVVAQEEIPAQELLAVPDLSRNVYEEAWSVMELSDAHRKELRSKRGFDDAWITALGIRTSRRGNRELLEPLLEKFPPNELLRSGIAVREKKTWRLRIADSLCGRIFREDEDGQGSWQDFENIVIPYIDAEGRIIGLRPHKRGLTNGDYREEISSEFYEKEHNNLRVIYGECFLTQRPEKHLHRCVICEGELKAAALRRCGIPAIGFQGIHFLRQNKETRQAVRDVVAMLRKHKIREVVVVFDNEDKSHKKPTERYEAELYARYTALCLEDEGFKAMFGMLPDEWREGGEKQPDGKVIKGKADWDGRLAWHLRKAKGNHAAALDAAAAEFEKLLANRTGKHPAVRPAPRQMDWMADFKEDVISQLMNKLRHEPDCFVGGRHELEVAAEIAGYCHADYADKLNIENLTKELRKSYGGYYMLKRPAEKMELRVIEIKKEVKKILEDGHTKPDKDGSFKELGEEDVRAYRAALLACNTLLYKNPKPFSNFTVISKYKVLVTEPDGTVRKDRLCTFIDSNGRKSLKPVQVNGEKMASSQELRKVVLRLDGYHWSGGQAEADAFVNLLDVENYQKTIIEIDSYGQHRDSGIFLLGDCGWAEDEKDGFLFPDYNGIIWYKGIGYKNSDALDTFCHRPPMMFPGAKNPKEAHAAIDWEAEKVEVARIWRSALSISMQSFGDTAGLGMVAGMLQYLAHPETLTMIGGKPGLWVQGAKGSGKTQTIKAFMRMLGYIENYGMVGLTGTKVGIERSLSQFDCLPVHLDEWRNVRASDDLVGFITNAFNGIAIAKGTAVGSKSIRLSRAATIPVITGEDMTTDTALLSRYQRLTMSAASRTGTQDEQREGYFRMLEESAEFFRIGRFLTRQRRTFGLRVVEIAKQFIADKETMAAIRDARAREVTGICYAALIAAQEIIVGRPFSGEKQIAAWFVETGKLNADEIEKDIFRLRWFADCVQMVTSKSDPQAHHFLQVRRGHILADGSVSILRGNNADIMLRGEGRLFIIVAPDELFPAYQRDQAKRRETVPINIRNIRQELRKERCWIAPPPVEPRQHRFTVEGFRPSKWWVMDYETAGDLKDIVSPIYEKFLYEHQLELDADGKVRPIDDQEPLRI